MVSGGRPRLSRRLVSKLVMWSESRSAQAGASGYLLAEDVRPANPRSLLITTFQGNSALEEQPV